ncbi:MAG: amidophosphoribosyltransferase [Sulfolobaceae archaeon]
MGGIVGILAFDKVWNVAPFIKYSLMGLQHRGYRSTFIGLLNEGSLSSKEFSAAPEDIEIEGLNGWIGVGENSSSGKNYVVSNNGILVYDGYVSNPKELIECVEKDYEKVLENDLGIFSMIYLSRSGYIIGFRDESGIKPLWLGGFGFDLAILASESVGISVIGAEPIREVKPGEVIFIDRYRVHSKQLKEPKPQYCSIEYIYQSRIDSVYNGSAIYDVRIKIGEELAKERPIVADVVIGVPDTAIPFAIGYARALGLRFDLGFARTGSPIRTMLASDEFMKVVGVQLKLNPIQSAVSGKRVVLIDDSMVTGTTLKLTAFMLRKMGAKEIHVLIGSPKLTNKCPYGVEIPDQKYLIAANLDERSIIRELGVDSIYWLSIDGLYRVIGHKNLCLGCMLGKYPKVVK